ncbi:MAG: 2-C-methyl-D-erythritol 4-phosphate cytidylyltransferase [Nitrospirae bacterium]|nr:2-C-methyl-D-erythritol 4-phosphate cytidylyltransferase [Nitrospirota bacterium]
MGSKTPKQFLELQGLPLLAHTLRAFESAQSVSAVVVVAPAADLPFCQHDIVDRHGFKKVLKLVPGGEERQDSVRHGVEGVDERHDVIIVHDAVRPFLTPVMIDEVVALARRHRAAIVAIPMRDTVKRVGESGLIEGTVDRQRLWLAQTPQAFERALLQEAHRKAYLDSYRATDDAQWVERLGIPVAIVEGSSENIKVTRPEDLAMGEAILAARQVVKREA